MNRSRDHDLYDDYYEWLLEQIKFNLPEHRKYGKLIDELNRREFTWTIMMDENRDMDGKYLRVDYLQDTGRDEDLAWNDPSSVLEVLVAFSRRIEIEITGTPGEDDLSRWFWVMIKNLGLLKFDDERFNRKSVNEILDIWLERRFKKDGSGSIFLTRKNDIDMRGVQMWYQMQYFLDENWSF